MYNYSGISNKKGFMVNVWYSNRKLKSFSTAYYEKINEHEFSLTDLAIVIFYMAIAFLIVFLTDPTLNQLSNQEMITISTVNFAILIVHSLLKIITIYWLIDCLAYIIFENIEVKQWHYAEHALTNLFESNKKLSLDTLKKETFYSLQCGSVYALKYYSTIIICLTVSFLTNYLYWNHAYPLLITLISIWPAYLRDCLKS